MADPLGVGAFWFGPSGGRRTLAHTSSCGTLLAGLGCVNLGFGRSLRWGVVVAGDGGCGVDAAIGVSTGRTWVGPRSCGEADFCWTRPCPCRGWVPTGVGQSNHPTGVQPLVLVDPHRRGVILVSSGRTAYPEGGTPPAWGNPGFVILKFLDRWQTPAGVGQSAP